MVSLFLKIIIAAIILVFLDILFSTLLGDFVTIGFGAEAEQFTLLTLLLRIFEILAAFLVLIIHAVTHLFQWEVFMDDIGLLIDGLVSIFLWLIGGFFQLLFKVLQFPFEILFGFLLKDLPSGIWISVPLIIEIIIDLRTLTFSIAIPNVPRSPNPMLIQLGGIGFQLVAKNTIGFSFFGLDQQVKLLKFGGDFVALTEGSFSLATVSNWKPAFGHLTFIFDLDTGFILTAKLEVVIPFLNIKLAEFEEKAEFILTLPTELETFSLVDTLNWLIGELPFPTPVEWIDSVYRSVVPAGVGGGASLLNQISEYNKVKKWQINRIV